MPRLGPRVLKVGKQSDLDMLLDGSEVAVRTALERAVRGRDEFVVWIDGDTGGSHGLHHQPHHRRRRCRRRLGDGSQGQMGPPGPRALEPRDGRRPARLPARHSPILSSVRPEDVRPDDRLILSATGRPLTPNGLYQAMGRTYRRGGGKGRFGLHRLRHLFGTSASDGGMHPRVSQEIMGHEDEKSQRIYQHPSAVVVKAEHAKVTPIRSIKRARRRKLA